MTALSDVTILVPGRLNPDTLAELKTLARVVERPNGDISDLSEAERASVRGAAVMGVVSAALMDALPNLEVVAHFGVGYDGVDVKHAVSRGIPVTNTPDVLTDEVADTTLGLLLMTARRLSAAERYLRAGRWAQEGHFPLTETTLRGRSVGIMGLGRIGLAIAARLEPFGVSIAYFNRSERTDVSYPYFATLGELADAVDTLIIAAPGGAGTEKAVNADVLKRLGSDGIFINIGRGSIVDEDALVAALRDGTIKAAGLDVFADEPRVREDLIALDNAVLLPHVASASRHTRAQMGSLVIENLRRWFAGETLATPVPEAQKAGLVKRP